MFKKTAAIFDAVGAYTDPLLRAMIAICVGQEELGKVFAVMEIAEGMALGAIQADTSLFEVIITKIQIWNLQKSAACDSARILNKMALNSTDLWPPLTAFFKALITAQK